MTREEFTTYISAVKRQWDFHKDITDVVSKYGGDFGILDYPDCVPELVTLLESIVHDKNGWISYYCWELEFGKDWKPGTVTDSDGNDIRLQSIDDLYDLLKRRGYCEEVLND